MDESNIELVRRSDSTPDINKLTEELRQAQADASRYRTRISQSEHWWNCWWGGQSKDGRKHSDESGEEVFPWEGASDTRLRTISGIIREHVTLAKFAFNNAKIQAKSVRPLQSGRLSNVATKLLNWRIYNHMRDELLRELPLAWAWRFGYGCSILSVEWQQERRLDYVEISLPILDEIAQAQGGTPIMMMLMDAINDPEQEDNLIALVQSLSPIVTTSQARKVVRDLRGLGTAQIPVAYPYNNNPKWTALRPCVDVLFPSETSNIQEARFVARREWVTETELRDRIETENYDPAFVDKALEHKGQSGLLMDDIGYGLSNEYGSNIPGYSYRDLIELTHVHYRSIMSGTPCVYKTVFNPLVKTSKPDDPLYATHGTFEYDHGQYPYVVLRRLHEDRPILSSRGIAEEAYTEEQAIKTQIDGLTDRTSIVLAPPMIVPLSRAKSIENRWLPRGVLEANRPQELRWLDLPPFDNTPLEVVRLVQERLDRRYAIFGLEQSLDPALKQIRQQEIANEILGEMELVLEQTFQLMQQYETEEEVQRVAGQLNQPWRVGAQEIQGKHEITATVDVKMNDLEYAKEKLALIAQAQAFRQEGILFNMAVEAIDPDAADDLKQNYSSPEAVEREKADELNAANQIANGFEPQFPIYGNHELRLQTLIGATYQNPNPDVMQLLMQRPNSMKILDNRIQMFQNQLVQSQVNPIVGRSLGTNTFDSKVAPQLAIGNGVQ